MGGTKRPAWVKAVERYPSGTLIVVEKTDGKLHGYHMPNRSLREGLIDSNDEPPISVYGADEATTVIGEQMHHEGLLRTEE